MSSPALRLLLIEDNPGFSRVLAQSLSESSSPECSVEVVSRLSDGLGRLAKGGVDVVLLDLNLPDSRGLETLRRLGSHAQNLPVVVLTGQGDDETALEAMRMGASDFLVKGDCNTASITRALRYAMERHQLLLQLKQAREEEASKFQDLTQRKKVTRALHSVETKFRVFFDESAMGIAMAEITGQLLAVNPALAVMLGYTPAELVGKNIRDVTHPEDLKEERERFDEIVSGKRNHFQMEKRYLRKDGQIVWGRLTLSVVRDAQGAVSFAIGFVEDITERKLVREQLRRETEFITTVLDTAQALVVVLDRERRVVRFNRACEQLTGYSFEEIRGKPIWDRFLMPEESDTAKAVFQDLTARRFPMTHQNYWLTRSGDCRWISWRNSAIPDSNGQVQFVVEIGVDMTVQRDAEEDLKKANQRLEQALVELRASQDAMVKQERLNALGQMASGIAHDFNNALSPVMGYSELLLMAPGYLEDQAKARQFLEVIHTAARDAASVVSRLREFYRHREEAENLQPIEIKALIRTVISLTQPKWKDQAQARGINVFVRTEFQNVPIIYGNESELREALTNLVFNAVDAMHKDGAITFRTRVEGDFVVVEVEDTGAGMAEEVRKRCMEPFFSTKGEKGTGLGLSMVFGIVQRHKGTIDIESESGKGTTVILCLPMEDTGRSKNDPELHVAVLPPMKVLVIDDEPHVRDVVERFLRADQHSVETAQDGEDGLRRFHAGRYDLVITDRAMPKVHGDLVAATIKNVSAQTPVILLTGFGDMMLAGGHRPDGVDMILNKPLRMEELRKAMAHVMRERIPAQDAGVTME